jgi:hypothetical protein
MAEERHGVAPSDCTNPLLGHIIAEQASPPSPDPPQRVEGERSLDQVWRHKRLPRRFESQGP